MIYFYKSYSVYVNIGILLVSFHHIHSATHIAPTTHRNDHRLAVYGSITYCNAMYDHTKTGSGCKNKVASFFIEIYSIVRGCIKGTARTVYLIQHTSGSYSTVCGPYSTVCGFLLYKQ